MLSLRRLPVRRTALASLAIGALIAGLSACSSVGSDAARIDGRTLSTSDFDELIDGFTAAVPSALMSSGNVSAESARSLLADWITTIAIENSLAADGIEVSTDDDAAAMADLMQQPSFAAASDLVRDFYAHATAVRAVLAEQSAPDAAELEATYNDGAEASGVVCARAILVDTEDDMATVQARLEAGDDFAAVASELSKDSSSQDGGILANPSTGAPCSTLDDMKMGVTPEFADAITSAEIGVPSEPFEIDGAGWVIIVLRPFDEVADDLAGLMSSGGNLEFVKAAVDKADIWVSSEYGVFDRDTATIVAN